MLLTFGVSVQINMGSWYTNYENRVVVQGVTVEESPRYLMNNNIVPNLPVNGDRIGCYPYITVAGSFMILAWRVISYSDDDRVYNFSITSEMRFGINDEGPNLYNDRPVGVHGESRKDHNLTLYYRFRSEPLVTDAATYWIGAEWSDLDSYANGRPCPLSAFWPERRLPAQGYDVVSMLVRWGPGSASRPILSLALESTIGTVHTFSVTIEQDDGDLVYLIAAIDRDPTQTLLINATGFLPGSFELSLDLKRFKDRGGFPLLKGGEYDMTIYAITTLGSFAEETPTFRVSFPGPTYSPSRSLTAAHTGTTPLSNTPRPTGTIPASPTPARSAYPVASVEAQQRALLIFGSAFYPVIKSSYPLRWMVRARGIGAAAIVGFEILNPGNDTITFSIGFGGPLAMNTSGPVTLRDYGDRDGFTATAGDKVLTFILEETTGVARPSTYWTGLAGDAPDNIWVQGDGTEKTGAVGIAMSWKNQKVGPKEMLPLSFVVRLGETNTPPVLTLNGPPSIGGELVSFSGDDRDADRDEMTLCVTFDNIWTGTSWILWQVTQGGFFWGTARTGDWSLQAGTHLFQLFAVDVYGTFSEVVTGEIVLSPGSAKPPRTTLGWNDNAYTPGKDDFTPTNPPTKVGGSTTTGPGNGDSGAPGNDNSGKEANAGGSSSSTGIIVGVVVAVVAIAVAAAVAIFCYIRPKQKTSDGKRPSVRAAPASESLAGPDEL
jgi:hypothetical protein